MLVLVAAGCSGPPGDAPPDAVGVYRGGAVLVSELDEELAVTGAAREGPPPPSGEDWREGAIRRIAVRKVLRSEATVDAQLRARVDSALSVVLVEEMAEELGWNRLTVTEEEVRRQYDRHPEQYDDPEKLRLQHIFFRAEAAEMTTEERAGVLERAESVRSQLLDGADFTAMARQHSESATAPSGGWMVLKRGAPAAREFVETAWSLDLNRVSEIVETANGFHVVVVRERFPELSRPFEAVREFARKRAMTEKRRRAERDFVDTVGPRYDLTKDYSPLSDPMIRDDVVLVSWRGGGFTYGDLVAQLPPAYLEHLYNHYFPKVHEFLDQVALNRMLLEEARRIGLAERPEVARRVERMVEDLTAERAMRQRLADRVDQIPDARMREYFAQNEKRYQTLRTRDLSLLLLPPGDNLWETLKLGESLVERVRSGAPFDELARTYSIHPSAADGGRIVAIDDHELARTVQSTARFRRALGQLDVGETAPAMVAECYDPDRLRFVSTGVLVFRKDGESPPEQVSYEDAEMVVRGNYLRRHHKRLVEEVEAEILAEIDLEILRDRLPPL